MWLAVDRLIAAIGGAARRAEEHPPEVVSRHRGGLEHALSMLSKLGEEAPPERDCWVKNPLVCRGCGSAENLHVMFWVNALSGQVDWSEPCFEVYDDPSQAGIQSTYCKACKADHGTVLQSERKAVAS